MMHLGYLRKEEKKKNVGKEKDCDGQQRRRSRLDNDPYTI